MSNSHHLLARARGLVSIVSLVLAASAMACGSESNGGDGGDAGRGGTDAGGGTSGKGGTSGNGGSANGGGSGTGTRPDAPDYIPGVTVDTFIGGSEAGSTDGDTSTASLSNPVSIVRIDDESFVFVDYDSSLVRTLDTDGNVASLEQPAGFSQPYGLARLGANVFIQTDRNAAGEKSPETGSLWSLALDEGSVSVWWENLGRPRSFAALDDATLVVADYVHHVVVLLDVASGALTTLAGTRGEAGYADGDGEEARFDAPGGIVVRNDGMIVVADTNNRRLRLLTPDGSVSTLAGEGSSATVDGPGDQASFVHPRALAVDADDNVYVADDGARRIRRVGPDGFVMTVAGEGSDSNAFADGDGESARFAGLEGLATSADGKTLYVADGNGGAEIASQMPFHRIRRVVLP